MNSIINYHGNKQIEHMPIFQPVQQPSSSQIVLHVQTVSSSGCELDIWDPDVEYFRLNWAL